MNYFSSFIKFRIDPSLPQELRRSLDDMFSQLEQSEVEELNFLPPVGQKVVVDIVSENSLHLLKPSPSFKICLLDKNQGLFSFGQNIESSLVDAVLDDTLDMKQIERLIAGPVSGVIRSREEQLYQVGFKNLRKLESLTRQKTQKYLEGSSELTSEALLAYAQALVDLEKELIHTDDISRMGKILRQFVKTNIEKAKFQFYSQENFATIDVSPHFLVLPKHKNEFLAIELNWEDADFFRQIKKLFFVYTLVNFFSSKQEINDPFYDDTLWESVLDSIPFPVALLSHTEEIYQHNSLFSKLNVAPADCLKYKLREKILINDIPYNIFRKEIHHLDENKILFVFFTESFFLKGDGNLTPSGQELGIISSSIAHELNNPIAGIQAALSLLMLDEAMNEEAKQTLVEMKNGAHRCKQLIETFLGFSRANPLSLQSQNSIDICYQQALNLLRFRTVESGIRFSLEFSRHSEFRASVNLSLLTMTFYLILGELMTLYSHQLLVADKNQIEKVIKGEIIESSQEIQIQLHELNISDLSLSKLIQNLLTIENFVLQVSDYSLRFIYNPPRDS